MPGLLSRICPEVS